jgi:hypothetical protein
MCCLLTEPAKTTFKTYNSIKMINNLIVKLNKPWFDGECKNASKYTEVLKNVPKDLEQRH